MKNVGTLVKTTVFTVASVVLLIAALLVAMDVDRFMRDSVIAPGRVIALNAGGSHPQIEFETQAGERVSYPQGGAIGGYQTGDGVRVRYRRANPRGTATLDVFGALWFEALVLGFLGGGMGIGAAATWRERRRG